MVIFVWNDFKISPFRAPPWKISHGWDLVVTNHWLQSPLCHIFVICVCVCVCIKFNMCLVPLVTWNAHSKKKKKMIPWKHELIVRNVKKWHWPCYISIVNVRIVTQRIIFIQTITCRALFHCCFFFLVFFFFIFFFLGFFVFVFFFWFFHFSVFLFKTTLAYK